MPIRRCALSSPGTTAAHSWRGRCGARPPAATADATMLATCGLTVRRCGRALLKAPPSMPAAYDRENRDGADSFEALVASNQSARRIHHKASQKPGMTICCAELAVDADSAFCTKDNIRGTKRTWTIPTEPAAGSACPMRALAAVSRTGARPPRSTAAAAPTSMGSPVTLSVGMRQQHLDICHLWSSPDSHSDAF